MGMVIGKGGEGEVGKISWAWGWGCGSRQGERVKLGSMLVNHMSHHCHLLTFLDWLYAALVFLGIPPNHRGKVWLLAIGNNLHITPQLFEIYKNRAVDARGKTEVRHRHISSVWFCSRKATPVEVLMCTI